MATDEVRIVLRGSSKQLEAAIQRIGVGLKRLQTQSVTTNRVMQAGAKRTSKSVNQQNKSITLLVAKFALLAFAIQTVANILNSTFGASLKSIDEFQVAAIGTATAVTNIADVASDGLGDAFNQNLQAALVTFEELELVAARFFSTGQELQLAFNTFAQRGVVIREEEFDILGKITDQIKLLTGGQNTQIQIQQEIRAILDGNVRTTTAFGKSLQARGVDVAQLSKEVRATGSIKVFEQFLTGLDAAGGAIRRTLSSVTATFSSLAAILNRRIFQDTFDTVVSQITDINNFIIDNIGLLVAMGQAVRDEVADGLSRAVGFADKLGGVILRVATSDTGKLIAAILLINKALRLGPVGAIFAIAAAFAIAAEDAGTFGKIVNIAFNALELAIKSLLPLMEQLLGSFEDFVRGSKLIIAASKDLGDSREFLALKFQLQGTESDIGVKRNNLEKRDQEIREAQQEGHNKDLIDLLEQGRTEQLASLVQSEKDRASLIEKISATQTAEVLGFFPPPDTKPFADKVKDTIDQLDKFLEELNENTGERTKTFSEQIRKLIADFAASVDIVPGGGEGEFTATRQTPIIDSALVLSQLKEQRAAELLGIQSTQAARKASFDVQASQIKQAAALREITGLEAFQQENALAQERIDNEIDINQQRINLAKRSAAEERNIISAQIAIRASEGLRAAVGLRDTEIKRLREIESLNDKQATRLQELLELELTLANFKELARTNEDDIKLAKINTTETQKVEGILRTILGLKTKGAKIELDASSTLIEETREVNRLLEQRDRDRETRGGSLATSGDRLDQARASSQIARDQFATENKGDTAAIDRFNLQQDNKDLQAVVKPQVDAFLKAIDATFQTLIDGIVEGSFEFRDLANSISKDLIKSGLEDLIKNVKKLAVEGLTSIFEAVGLAAAGKAAQALSLAIGLLLAVLSKTGNKGDFTATGGAGGGGLDSSGIPTRGLIGGDTSLPIAQINEGLQEAMIPTNAILSQIEFNTRALADLNLGIDPNALSQAIAAQVQGLFSQALLQTP